VLDEQIDVLRACWTQDPVTFHGDVHEIVDVRVLPQPAHPIPIWVGGHGERGWRRAWARGDGFHAIGLDPQQAADMVRAVRAGRPEPEFTVSLRTGWDPQGMDVERIVRERDDYAAAGITHMLAAPWRTDLPSWLESMRRLADLLQLVDGEVTA
jgi:alkanesulfonate monooxygenase SsuD/methylene tetrahydromethanopterin reductase-like flavin-dependent oxidoreductase (luciferase family)